MQQLLLMILQSKEHIGINYHYRKNSFESISEWVKEIKDNTDSDALIYLVGNRADLEEER